ncbi:unnamed protein product [Mucor hiemalis]
MGNTISKTHSTKALFQSLLCCWIDFCHLLHCRIGFFGRVWKTFTVNFNFKKIRHGARHTPLDKQTCIIGLTLMTLHLARRCYELFLIERPSKTATMHVSHYLIGIGFYGAMVFGTWLEGLSSFKAQSNNNNNSTIYTTVIAIGLFFYASLHQYHCHVILASLRKDTDKGYTIPRGDWFEQIVVPHYFADILIYLSLCILYRFQNCILLCGLIWTTTNLSIVASETHSWYQHHFTIEKLKITFPHRRWRIIPYVY